MVKPWRKSLVFKVLGKTMGFKFLEQRLRVLWSLKKGFEITDLEQGYFIIRFKDKEDYNRVLDGGPWLIQEHYILIRKWSPNFSATKEDISNTLVWLRLPGLPVQYYDEEFLMKVGNALGKAVKIDVQTARASREKYARICVEIDLKKALTPFVWIDDICQSVEYEGLHAICFKCGKYGHGEDQCQLLNEAGASTAQIRDKGKAMAQMTSEETPFGPWMIASRRNFRRGVNHVHETGGSKSVEEGGVTAAHSDIRLSKNTYGNNWRSTATKEQVVSVVEGVVPKTGGSRTRERGSRFEILDQLGDGDMDEVIQGTMCRETLKAVVQGLPEPPQFLNFRHGKNPVRAGKKKGSSKLKIGGKSGGVIPNKGTEAGSSCGNGSAIQSPPAARCPGSSGINQNPKQGPQVEVQCLESMCPFPLAASLQNPLAKNLTSTDADPMHMVAQKQEGIQRMNDEGHMELMEGILCKENAGCHQISSELDGVPKEDQMIMDEANLPSDNPRIVST